MLLALLTACTPPCADHTDAAPHSVTLSWDAHTAQGSAAVSFSLDGEDIAQPAGAQDGGWLATIADLPPLHTVAYSLWEGEQVICTGAVQTTNLPNLPTWTTTGSPSWSRLLGVSMGTAPAIMVLDGEGRYRWHHRDPDGRGLLDAVPTEQGLRYNTLDPDRIEDLGAVIDLSDDGEITAERPAPGMHHNFADLPGGGFAYLSVDVRDWTDPATGQAEPVVGDAIWEVGADGLRTLVYSTWDHLDPAPHGHWDSDFYAQGRDWTHGNGLSYDPERDSYLLALANLDTIVEVDRQTGAPLLLIEPSAWDLDYAAPHAPTWVGPDRLLLLSYAEGAIGAVEYAVDADAQRLAVVWSRTRSEALLPFLGHARRLANGNTLVNYGAGGIVEEVTPDGAVIWELRAGFGSWLGATVPLE